jgi:hypothetical protein
MQHVSVQPIVHVITVHSMKWLSLLTYLVNCSPKLTCLILGNEGEMSGEIGAYLHISLLTTR